MARYSAKAPMHFELPAPICVCALLVAGALAKGDHPQWAIGATIFVYVLHLAVQWIKRGTSSADGLNVTYLIVMKMRASAVGLTTAAAAVAVIALLSGTAVAQPAGVSLANPLEGKPLRYLIGTDISGPGREGEIIEVSYSTIKPTARGISIKYCNLFDEENTGRYGPYLHTSDTAAQYNEGQIDPAGPGWTRNLQDQYKRATAQGFEYIELDNADAYRIEEVLSAVELAKSHGLKVIAKNPLLIEGEATPYVAHPNVFGVIVERGAGSPADMDALRKKAGKPNLPVWFVAFGDGRAWAGDVANAAKPFHNMGVTYSSAGEYGNSIDLLRLDRGSS